MREALLHYIWKDHSYSWSNLKSITGEAIQILFPGISNSFSGPDFLQSKIKIGDTEWVGQVELHIKASDWYIHQHQKDKAYNNVILHVVWEADAQIKRSNGSLIPTLALNSFISLSRFQQLKYTFQFKKDRDLNCGGAISEVGDRILDPWKDELFEQRLQKKILLLDKWLNKSVNDWEQAFFILLLKSFGLNINGEAFQDLAEQIDFKIIRKNSHDPYLLESIFLGKAGLLDKDYSEIPYFNTLKFNYKKLSNKYSWEDEFIIKPEFFSIRPNNFPTLRLSQCANLYYKSPALFTQLINATSVTTLRTILRSQASPYWDTHYTFGKQSKPTAKITSRKFLDLLILNAVLPVKWMYMQRTGIGSLSLLRQLASEIRVEHNKIQRIFGSHGLNTRTAFESQAMIHLFQNYCSKNKCLDCKVGQHLLSGKC